MSGYTVIELDNRVSIVKADSYTIDQAGTTIEFYVLDSFQGDAGTTRTLRRIVKGFSLRNIVSWERIAADAHET